MNAWITTTGRIVPVANGRHAMIKPRGRGAIRVSTPEGRRTFTGIESTGVVTLPMLRTLKRMIRDLDGSGIVAEICGRRAECWNTSRPQAIHHLINKLIGDSTPCGK